MKTLNNNFVEIQDWDSREWTHFTIPCKWHLTVTISRACDRNGTNEVTLFDNFTKIAGKNRPIFLTNYSCTMHYIVLLKYYISVLSCN